ITPSAAMPTPGPTIAGCPPGLEYLTQIDQILVEQKVDYAELIVRWEMSNNYVIKNNVGQQIFMAKEDSSNFFSIQFFGTLRPFNIHIHDNLGRDVLTVTRPVKCGSCCCPCCLQEVEIQSPPGVPIGYVVQDWHPFFPKFTIMDAARSAQLKIKGPFCDCRCCSDVVFQVLSRDEETIVGQISKRWGGFLQEGFTDADNFGISFPMDLDVKVKAVLLGAVFLIDFMYFETNKNQN
uniref:Phospholipid scramblase n=1 Tax=Neogobius melanostomus TaxID=47308 RepID=A0A8C6WUI9_9GOBI